MPFRSDHFCIFWVLHSSNLVVSWAALQSAHYVTQLWVYAQRWEVHYCLTYPVQKSRHPDCDQIKLCDLVCAYFTTRENTKNVKFNIAIANFQLHDNLFNIMLAVMMWHPTSNFHFHDVNSVEKTDWHAQIFRDEMQTRFYLKKLESKQRWKSNL